MHEQHCSLWGVIVLICAHSAAAATYDIRDFGATPDDETDDTLAIRSCFEACHEAGGGVIEIPTGTFLVSRQGAESPILELPSQTLIRGEGPASVLKFPERVNDTNFWRMLGAGGRDCRDVTIRDLHLDGSNTFQSYDPGVTPEHNHGIFLHRASGVIENILIEDCLIENFSGDCVGMSVGCRQITVRSVTLRNFVRQGIQMAGDEDSQGYLVTGCQDLAGDVDPGGSTIHVEHADGVRDVIITGNRCRHSILAGGVDGIIIRNNTITGRLVGNGNSNAIVAGNIIRGPDAGISVLQLGFTNGLILKDNVILSDHEEAIGIYVWGSSRYNPEPSRDVLIADNLIRSTGRGVFLNGVNGGTVRGNRTSSVEESQHVVLQRCEEVQVSTSVEVPE